VAAVFPGDRPPGHAADALADAYGGTPFGPTIDPVVGFAVAVWSLTSALGVLLFAVAMRRVTPREPEPVGRRRGLLSFRSGRWSATAVANVENPASHATVPEEAYLPRWLRPSLRAERASNEQTAAFAMRDPIVFAAPPAKGAVRSTVAYRLVRVSDAPNDHTSVEIGRLDRGDEVEIVGDSEGYLKVRTPTGLEGWVPRMVLVG
jgi:hypothetical protein